MPSFESESERKSTTTLGFFFGGDALVDRFGLMSPNDDELEIESRLLRSARPRSAPDGPVLTGDVCRANFICHDYYCLYILYRHYMCMAQMAYPLL